ncbi:MAG: rRNA maturation RNase YbeY [Bacteroidales bacterium]|nr:rRNA maturation RNase YbeY [Bacteroidales bacterium]
MISFFTEDTGFSFRRRIKTRSWLRFVAKNEGKTLGDVNIIFCSDKYLLDVNVKYLGHSYYTDIITFDYCEGRRLSGDLFISIDSVLENSLVYGAASFDQELNRVIVHGLLHLVGYDDHTPEDQKTMREKENFYLSYAG